jgi:hypothetical protein
VPRELNSQLTPIGSVGKHSRAYACRNALKPPELTLFPKSVFLILHIVSEQYANLVDHPLSRSLVNQSQHYLLNEQ